MTPFQGDIDPDENQINIFDPKLGYALVGKIGDIQANGTLTYYHGTSQESKNVDMDAALVASYSFLKAWQNKLTTGISFTLADYFYGTDPGEGSVPRLTKRRAYGGDNRTDWSVGIFPFAEYTFTDKYSFRTVFGYFNWRHLYGDDNRWRLQTYVYQSVGIGISLNRDVYLYPNVQFVPDNIRADFTNVALSATINTF
jgi:hypothetical protein